MPEKRTVEARIAEKNLERAKAKRKTKAVVQMLGASPAEAQLTFLRHLMENEADAQAFLDNPEAFAAGHGVVVDPDLVRGMVDTAVFGEPISEDLATRLGPEVTDKLLDLQGGGRVAILPIAVATAVAVASAAVALVANSSEALSASVIKGFDLPPRSGILVSTTAAVVYATTAITSSTVVAAAKEQPVGLTAATLNDPGLWRGNK